MRQCLVIAFSSIVWAGCSEPSGTVGDGRIEIVSSPDLTDSVGARPPRALVVEVLLPGGIPPNAATVRFDVDPSRPEVLIEPIAGGGYGPSLAVPADSRGRAAVLLRFGGTAGKPRIRIFVPELGYERTIELTVVPGAPASVFLSPKDTSIYRGRQYQIQAQAVDRFGNPVPGTLSYAVGAGGVGTVSASGLVSAATAFERGNVIASLGEAKDSIAFSVVPEGTIAAVSDRALVIVDLDGSGRRSMAFGLGQNSSLAAPNWFPDGSRLVYSGVDHRLATMSVDGVINQLITAAVPNLGVELTPTVSRDGTVIYFSGGNISTGNRTIWRVERDGSGARSITGAVSGGDFSPSVERGNVVAFFTPIGVIRMVVPSTSQVLPIQIPGIFPRFAPSADLIAVNSDGIAVSQIDGSGKRRLTDGMFEGAASWSPDSQWLVARGRETLELVRVSDGMRLPLPWANQLTQPAWKP